MTVTNNRNLTLPTVGGDSGTWGTELNSGVITALDTVLGSTTPVSITSADVTLSQAQWNNAVIQLTGTLTGNRNLVLPIGPNASTTAVGGYFIVDNQTAGAFNVTVKTAASGSSGVIVPQGLRALLWSNSVNVAYAHDSAVLVRTTNGSPNGQLAGTAGSVNNPPFPWAYDYTNDQLYLPTTTGTAASTVWTNVALLGGSVPMPQGRLTPTSATPVLGSDVTAATVLYYTPFVGEWVPIHNGTQIIPYNFAEMSLTLSASQAALNIYDIFLAYNSGTPVIGTGPSWSASGGSITAGSCSRGSAAGSTALDRSQGFLTNNVSISLIYNTGAGNNTITVPANQGIYLGSIFIDNASGQISCHVSYGQNRKWAVWNAYNRVPISMIGGDTTASWTGTGAGTFGASNANSANVITAFAGLAEEEVDTRFSQVVFGGTATNCVNSVGIGLNSTSTPSGFQGQATTRIASVSTWTETIMAEHLLAPTLGINALQMLEKTTSSGGNFTGTSASMQMCVNYRG